MWLKVLLLSIVLTASSEASSELLLTADKNAELNVTINLEEILKSFNWSKIQYDDSQQLANLQATTETQEFEKSLAVLFRKTISTNWQTRHALQVIAAAANDITVYEILYKVLWQELSSDRNKSNPVIYLELYQDLEDVMTNMTSDKLQKLHEEIKRGVENCSATILQSFFIQKKTVWQLLAQLKQFNNLYQLTVPHIFENLNSIEDQWEIAKGLLEFDANTEEAISNHLSYIKYLKSRLEPIPYELYNNLELLIARQDFVNISAEERRKTGQLLPLSMKNLFATDKICIRNKTVNLYLYECPQTYLLCTNFVANNNNPVNRKKAAFDIQRIGKDLYRLHSPYWSRYLHLQEGSSKNLSSPVDSVHTINTTISKVTKNLYSSTETSSWFIRFRDDYATIQDSTGVYYICGGNSSYWNNMEKHAYTRQSINSNEMQQECLWLLEDCSDVSL